MADYPPSFKLFKKVPFGGEYEPCRILHKEATHSTITEEIIKNHAIWHAPADNDKLIINSSSQTTSKLKNGTNPVTKRKRKEKLGHNSLFCPATYSVDTHNAKSCVIYFLSKN